jgi:predicted component of type VI protein secretion system
MRANKQEDRRRFFRITDAIGVMYDVIDTDNNKSKKLSDKDEKKFIDMQLLIKQNDETISTAVKKLKEQQPQAARAVDAINKKLDTIIKLFELENHSSRQDVLPIEDASISACGIAFPINEYLEKKTKLKLTLYLQTSGDQVEAEGRVIECRELKDENYYLRVEFTSMTSPNRESLIQHIVQRQGVLLRSLRNNLEH